jgi:L-fuconolactonase
MSQAARSQSGTAAPDPGPRAWRATADAQVHVWDKAALRNAVPTLDGQPSLSSRVVTPEDVLAWLDANGVRRAVLVPRNFAGDDQSVALAAAREHPDRFGVMARVGLGDPGQADRIRTWRDEPGRLGVRLNFSTAEPAELLDDDGLDWVWTAAESGGVPVAIYPPRRVERIAVIARRHPELRLLVDHLGLANGTRGPDLGPEIDRLLLLAEYPNVAVKASALPAFGPVDDPCAPVPELFDRLLAAFGAERVFWGSDATRLTCSYEQAFEQAVASLAHRRPDEVDLVLGRGLCAWLDWPLDS